jgi:hypothetical protein
VFLPRRTSLALGRLMNMRRRRGRRLVVALEPVDGDVEADDVLVDVDAVVEQPRAALEATRGLVLRVDDLVRGGDNLVSRGELEGDLASVATVAGARGKTTGVLDGRGLGEGREGEDGEGLHGEGVSRDTKRLNVGYKRIDEKSDE